MLRLLKKNVYYLFFSLFKWIKYPTCRIYTNHIHPTARIGKHVIIEKYCKIDKGVEIGDHTFINEYTRVDFNCRSIGKYCSISHNVKIGMGPHPLGYFSTSPVFYSKARGFSGKELYDEIAEKGYTSVGNDVFIAANAIILAGVTVGDGSVVAAGSIVTKDVPPYAIVAGNPARIVRYRFDEETRRRLLESRWWDMDVNSLLDISEVDVKPFLDRLEKTR